MLVRSRAVGVCVDGRYQAHMSINLQRIEKMLKCADEMQRTGKESRIHYSPTKSLVPPTILVRVRCRVRVHGSGLGLRFWNLVGGTRDLVGE